VDRADRGGIEFRDRPLQTAGLYQPVLDAIQQMLVEQIVGLAHDLPAPQDPGGRHHPSADPIPQFRSRVSGVGGDQNVSNPQPLLRRDRMRDVGRDRVCLARSGARLDQRAVFERMLGETEILAHARR